MNHPTAPAPGRPFWADVPARATRRGNYWLPGERVSVAGKTYQHGPLYVA